MRIYRHRSDSDLAPATAPTGAYQPEQCTLSGLVCDSSWGAVREHPLQTTLKMDPTTKLSDLAKGVSQNWHGLKTPLGIRAEQKNVCWVGPIGS